MNGNNNTGNLQQSHGPPQQQQQQQQQMFNQTPQMGFQQAPPPGMQGRGNNAQTPLQQQQQQQRFNMSQQQMMAAQQQQQQQQQLQQQNAMAAAAAAAAASGRPVPQRNPNYNGSPNPGQTLPLNNNNNNSNKTGIYNPNALATGMPSSNLQPTSSAGNSRGHTPRMVNQPQPFIPHQQNQPPLPPQQQQQPTPQLPPQGQTPQQVQMGYPKKVNNGNLVANQSLKSGPMGGPVPMGGPQQARIPPNSSFQQSPQTQFAMPPNSNGPINPQQQQQQQQQHGPNQNPQPTVSGRSPIQRQMIIATTTATGGKGDTNNSVQEQVQQEINTRIIKRNLGNAAIIRVLDLIEFISNQHYENLSNIEFWTKITPANFLPTAILKFNTTNITGGNGNKSLNDIT